MAAGFVIPSEARNLGFRLHYHCCLILLVRAFEVGEFVIAFEVPDAGCDFVDQIVIVAYQEDRPLISLQGNVQRIDGFEIEVVRGFIEHEYVWLLQH